MSLLNFSSTDRVLIFAPHPDDESLATGGLLQRAFAAGAAVRVVLITSGDNNPWPQRALERRLRVGLADRARWASRRRAEARAAVRLLGGRDGQIGFLNFPDGGLTQILMRGGEHVIAQFAAEIADWRPTVLVIPAAEDAHPDHTATNVMIRFALARLDARPAKRLEYLVHSPRIAPTAPRSTLTLTAGEIACKRDAILCHKTQMVLSRTRFVAYAKVREKYQLPREADIHADDHPVYFASMRRGALLLVLKRSAIKRPGSSILLAGQSPSEGPFRCSLSLPLRSGLVHLRDDANGSLQRRATVRYKTGRIEIRVPFTGAGVPALLFVKACSPSLFHDAAGWREITLDRCAKFTAPVRHRTFTRRPVRAAS